MKTVSQFAIECGVSSKTIYRRISKLGQMSDIVRQGGTPIFSEKINGITYVTTDGEDLLKERFGQRRDAEGQKSDTVGQNRDRNGTEMGQNRDVWTDKSILILEDQVKFLREQLAEREGYLKETLLEKEQIIKDKDQQIKDCFIMLAQMNGDMKKLQAANENIHEGKEIIEHRPVQGEKKTFWNKIFGR